MPLIFSLTQHVLPRLKLALRCHMHVRSNRLSKLSIAMSASLKIKISR